MKTKSTARVATAKDGVDIHYWLNYKPGMDKRMKVLHPGAGMNHSSFEPLESGLNERGHPTILIEQRGRGFSEAPKDREFYTLQRFSEDLELIAEKEGLEKPSFVCHSFGFMPIVDYVYRTNNASDITGICVSDDFSKTTFPSVIKGFGLFGYTDYIGNMIGGLLHKVHGEKRTYNDQSRLEGKSDFSIWLSITDVPFNEVIAPMLNNIISQTYVTDQLKGVNVPIHLIQGRHDFMVFARKSIERIKHYSSGPVTADILPGSHSLPYKSPNEVLEVMDKFEKYII